MKPFNQPNLFEQPKWEIHVRENNPESQEHLNNNKGDFSKQCSRVYSFLMSGIELTTEEAMLKYKIKSLPRRLLDLKTNGVQFHDRWENGCKVWFMTLLDINENRGNFGA